MKSKADIGPVKMSEQEINSHLESGNLYVVCFKRVYHIEHANYKPEFIPYYGRLVYTSQVPLTERGAYHATNARELNRMIGHELFTD